MNIVLAQFKKDFRLNRALLLTLWSMLAFSIVFPLSNFLDGDTHRILLYILPILAYFVTASVHAQDSSSDTHAFWRMQPISASKILIAKIAFVFIFVVVPVVALHWFSLQRLPINIPFVQIVEPLAWYTTISLAIGLLGAVCSANRLKFILISIAGFWLLTLLSHWILSALELKMPRYDGTGSIIMTMTAFAVLLVAHWACYLRKSFNFQIGIAASTLLFVWFAVSASGAWFNTTHSPQPLNVLGIDSLTSDHASLHRYEKHSFDETETILYTKVRLPKHIQENFILRSRSWLNGANFGRFPTRGYSRFDHGLFSLAQTRLGFATNEDRVLKNPVLNLARINQQELAKLNQSAIDIDVRFDFMEPHITVVADIPFKGGAEITYRDEVYNIDTKIFDNSRFSISLKGITQQNLTMGVILYNPAVKEIVVTELHGGTHNSLPTYLDRPKLRSSGTEWQAAPWTSAQGALRKSSTGYTIITKPPSNEWLEKARIKVYETDFAVPVSQTLKFDGINLAEIPLVEQYSAW